MVLIFETNTLRCSLSYHCVSFQMKADEHILMNPPDPFMDLPLLGVGLRFWVSHILDQLMAQFKTLNMWTETLRGNAVNGLKSWHYDMWVLTRKAQTGAVLSKTEAEKFRRCQHHWVIRGNRKNTLVYQCLLIHMRVSVKMSMKSGLIIELMECYLE